MQKLALGAYQSATFESGDLGEQFTDGGKAPRTMVVQFTTAMDDPFVNRTVTALLSEQAQRDIIKLLQVNLDGMDL